MITLRIDDQKIEVAEGTNLLNACLANGIYIPNLCYIEGIEHPPVSCRLCFVEIEGTRPSRFLLFHAGRPGDGCAHRHAAGPAAAENRPATAAFGARRGL